MHILNEVDKPGSDIENYLSRLEKNLSEKKKGLDNIEAMVNNFKILMKVK